MKDLIITTKRQKAELLLFCTCILIAFLLNVCSIVVYQTEWKELYTQWLWMLIIGCGLYGLSVVLRIIYCLLHNLFSKRSSC